MKRMNSSHKWRWKKKLKPHFGMNMWTTKNRRNLKDIKMKFSPCKEIITLLNEGSYPLAGWPHSSPRPKGVPELNLRLRIIHLGAFVWVWYDCEELPPLHPYWRGMMGWTAQFWLLCSARTAMTTEIKHPNKTDCGGGGGSDGQVPLAAFHQDWYLTPVYAWALAVWIPNAWWIMRVLVVAIIAIVDGRRFACRQVSYW